MKNRNVNASLFALLALSVLTASEARADYKATVLADSPKGYYNFNDDTTRPLINKNSGSLGAVGNATNDLAGIVHSYPGAIVGDGNRAIFFDTTTRTEIPFNPALNPPNTQPFTVEAWLYPASDQTASGMAPLANRYTQGANRQGWVFFQRRPNADYFGGEQVGWGFRMYNGVGGSSPLDTVSLVPYEVGKWQHVVVVYDPVDANNASVTMYINGVAAITNVYSGAVPGYAPCTGDHPPGEAVNGQPAMALGNYNNANNSLNPWFGAADEFAFYSAKLTPAQILSHYQNGTNASRAIPYATLIQSHNPVAYLRLDEIAPSPDLAVNIGDLRNTGVATHTAEARHPATGAVVSDPKSGAAAYHNRNGKATTTMPFLDGNNPNAGIPFTFEAWLRPLRDSNGGQCPVNNRWPKLGHRTGWVIFQRTPNLTYNQGAGEGHGWNFRMYDGATGTGQDVLTGTDYVVGQWQHLVVTWEPQIDNGDPSPGGVPTGNDQWQGVLTAYVDGVQVAQNASALYAANRLVPEDNGVPADFAVGSYNAASTLGNNPYEGNVGEVAFYNNYVLTPDQILAHYQAGTNSSNLGTNYETLVMTAGFTGPERVGLPKTYLRFNDPAYYPAANGGTVGYLADGDLVMTTNLLAGPRSPAYAGFSTTNTALPLDGLKQWASFNNPAGLEISGQITLEAWIKPDAIQADPARIISHGPQTPSDFLTQGLDNAVTNTSEVFLAIEGGANYVVGSREVIDGTTVNTYSASFPIPGGDLGGGNWVHLVGTYDGSNWRLYRNGTQVASAAAAVGALPVNNGDWAVGSTGNGWANNFAGGADEVAIYNKALTPSQVANHYVIGKAGTTALTIARATGNNVTITWPAGTTLQQSSLVTGTYTNTPGNPVSPLTIPASGTKFYRWSLP
ncbi:MAG: LamG domain-containing protein [Verrucomicrobiota bacterium]